MGMIKRGWVFGLMFLLLPISSCHIFKQSPRPEPEVLPGLLSEKIDSLPALLPISSPEILLQVQRKGCGGPCPEWEARFFSSGMITFIGKSGTALDGAYKAQYDKEDLANFFNNAERAGFYALPDTIGENLLQLPAWDIRIHNDSLSHRVFHAHHGPSSLHFLEQDLETWILSLRWERID